MIRKRNFRSPGFRGGAVPDDDKAQGAATEWLAKGEVEVEINGL